MELYNSFEEVGYSMGLSTPEILDTICGRSWICNGRSIKYIYSGSGGVI
jgi:hypothetical protein